MTIGKLIGYGRTANIFEWEEDKIVKLFHENYPREFIEYEYKASDYIQKVFPCTPKTFGLVEQDNQLGIVFEKIEAITLLDYLLQDPLRIFKEIKKFAQIHVQMHECEFTGFKTQKAFLEWDIQRGKNLSGDQKKKILVVLDQLPDGNNLCHRDYHPDNLFYTEEGLIVIDWMTATQGDPAADVARTYFILKHASPVVELTKIEKIKVKLFQSITSRIYLKNYLKQSKLSRKDIQQWELVTIASRIAEDIPQEKKIILDRIKKLMKE